jgi:hypothetical protein
MSETCDIAVCRSFGACDLAPRWCRVWRYVHNVDRSPANAAYLSEKIPGRYVGVDARGRVTVAPGGVRGGGACEGGGPSKAPPLVEHPASGWGHRACSPPHLTPAAEVPNA